MILRDLVLRARLEEEGLISTLEQANEEMNDLAAMSEEAQASLEELGEIGAAAGEGIAGGLEAASDATGGFVDQLRAVQPALGAIGLAGLGFVGVATRAATELEWATTRLRILADEAYPQIARAIESEVERLGRALTFGQLSELLAPIAATLPGHADIITKAIRQIDDAIIMMGGDAQAAERAWLYIAQAIGSGSAEILTRASRWMPFPLIRGEEAIAIARQMSREYDALTNAMILMEAIAKSERIEQEKLNQVMDTTRFRILQLHGAWGDFLEEVGAGQAQIKGTVAEGIASALDKFLEAGGGEPLGRWLTVYSTLLAGVGGRALLSKVLGWLGIGGGTISGALFGVMLPLGILALAIEDLWTGFTGGKSVILDFSQSLLDLREQFWRYTNDWGETVQVTADNWKQAVGQMWRDWQIQRDLAQQQENIQRALEGEMGQEVAWEVSRSELARELVEGLEYPLIVSEETRRMGWPAIAASIFGPNWELYARKVHEGEMSVEEALRQAQINRMAEQATETVEGAPSPAAPTVHLDPQVEESLKQLADREQTHITLEIPPTTTLFGNPQITISFGPGAITVAPEGMWELPEEEREKIINETLEALEAQLRAVLNEQARPGAR